MNQKTILGFRSVIIAGVLSASLIGTTGFAQTPEVAGCSDVGTPVSSMGSMDHGTMGDMEMTEAEFDQLYIDMMLPHHGSIVALAEVALPLLEDRRLQEIAQTIIDTQTAEQAELEALRMEWYGSPAPAPMDDAMMSMMMEAMPGMGSAEEQMQIMDAQWQIQTFCAAENYDLQFIDQTIPHHQMAIDSSESAVEQAVHPEIVTIAERVIADQQAEIDELEVIRAELSGDGTPAA